MITPLLIVSAAFSLCYMVLVMYYFTGWLRLKKESTAAGGPQPFISVIVPVRNESENIEACLASIFKQTYPAHLFEVIVIDDYSTDPTLRLARAFNQPNLLVLDLMQYLGNPGEYVPNKKKALALGIKNARGELIITTDGDCTHSENWLTAMVGAYTKGNYQLLTGPVMQKPAKNPFTWFQQLDVINLLGITGATIRNGMPTMCNGANMLYSKALFHQVEGFKGNHEVPTGDDIFLMQKVRDKYPGSIGFVKNFEACVFTRPEKSLGGFVSQRVRWISKSSKFSSAGAKLMLYFAYLFNLLIVVDALNLLQGTYRAWLPLAVAACAKFLAELIFNIPLVIFFRKGLLLLFLPFMEAFHILYVVFIGILSLGGTYTWKDRQVS